MYSRESSPLESSSSLFKPPSGLQLQASAGCITNTIGGNQIHLTSLTGSSTASATQINSGLMNTAAASITTSVFTTTTTTTPSVASTNPVFPSCSSASSSCSLYSYYSSNASSSSSSSSSSSTHSSQSSSSAYFSGASSSSAAVSPLAGAFSSLPSAALPAGGKLHHGSLAGSNSGSTGSNGNGASNIVTSLPGSISALGGLADGSVKLGSSGLGSPPSTPLSVDMSLVKSIESV
ncbi:unnamed protein product [Protopolystoma xenopodis]|uniref:Uncharacterized protein n=1 Tax=Protopolystoma xenopodis TaxID=117903 RepID=A0A3S5AZK3_9PLAT|nr:unnamed protein product [Protopolystoma xenopodis]